MLEKQLPYKHKVYAAIKKDILQGHYAPGDILNERRLSEELGISRTPVREALQMLEQDGWLKMETYKGAVVREFDPHYMRNLSRIRTALEVCALEEAVSNITICRKRRWKSLMWNPSSPGTSSFTPICTT